MIGFQIDVDDRAVKLRLEDLPSRLRSRLHPVIARLTEELLGRVRAAEPDRTGKLRAATQAFVDDKENFVRGRVRVLAVPGRGGSHNIAAAALEYGAHGLVEVKQHQTHIDTVFGRVMGRQLAIVDAYNRRENITAERFLRGPAAALRPTALAALQQVVDEAVKE
jgi:hypothetical protein